MAQKKKKTEEVEQTDSTEEVAESAETVEEVETEVVDDDGHTIEDITPMDIEGDDDDETAVNADDDPDEYKNWDRDEFGPMSDYAVEAEDEPKCCSEDDDDFEPGE